MIDERLKTRDESETASSPTKRHPEHRERSIKHLSSLSLSKGLLLISFLFFAACTDYVQKMDDDFDEWEQVQQQAELSSSSQSSSSVFLSSDSREKSSNSSKEKVSSSSNNKASSSSTKSSSSNKVSSSSEQKSKSSSSVKTTSSSSKATSSSSLTKSSSSSAKAVSSSSSKKNEVSSSSENLKTSSSGKASSWAYLNPAISYGEIVDNRDGQVYKTVKIGEQTWMAENLNLETENSTCHEQNSYLCPTFKYGKLYQWSDAMDSIGIYSSDGKDCGAGRICNAKSFAHGICPQDWHLPSIDEWITLCKTIKESPFGIQAVGFEKWTNATNIYGFSAIPAGHHTGYYNNIVSEDYSAEFWSSTEISGGNQARFFQITPSNFNTNYVSTSKKYGLSVRCIKNENNSPISSSSIISSSSSKVSWAYLNPAISYGEIVDDRDGQVYKTVVIDSKTWMAENLNYESVKSYCYENKKDSCSKYGHLYIWSAAMDSIGAFSTNSKGCGYPNECHNTKNPVRGVCPEKWHIPSQQEWYDLSTYNSSTIREDLSSAGERLKSANGWFNSGDGDNTYGFSVLPAGTGSEENYSRSGEKTCFWSSSDGNGIDAYGIHFEYSNNKGVLQGTMKSVGCSIRCVKD